MGTTPCTMNSLPPSAHAVAWGQNINFLGGDTFQTQWNSSPYFCALFCAGVSGAVGWTIDSVDTCWCKWGISVVDSNAQDYFYSGLLPGSTHTFTTTNRISFKCNEGYSMSGDSYAYCKDAKFSAFPTCQPINGCATNNGGCGSTDCVYLGPGKTTCSSCSVPVPGVGCYSKLALTPAEYVTTWENKDDSDVTSTSSPDSEWRMIMTVLLSCVALAVVALLAYKCLTHKRTEYASITSIPTESETSVVI